MQSFFPTVPRALFSLRVGLLMWANCDILSSACHQRYRVCEIVGWQQDSPIGATGMGYRNLRQCIDDLMRNDQLIECAQAVDARLEMAEIQRRICARGGPAVLFTNVRDCRFPVVCNLFGTIQRARFIFRDTMENVRRAIELKIDAGRIGRRPLRYWRAPLTALAMRPRLIRHGASQQFSTSITQLPQQVSWPDDGGAFITLPQVYTENVEAPGWKKSNLGMYRVQISGGRYRVGEQVGLHYQIHRGIGVHHEAARRRNKPLLVNIFVGGAPAMTLAAVMPLPEGLSELTFAGALAGHRIPMVRSPGGLPVYAEADFCICGTVENDLQLPEGPFGDHLGYYSLVHDFPVLRVQQVTHRRDPIWPLTVVGRPPQEDTVFGQLIHELTGPVIPSLLAGVKAVHAVDAAGVHPLLLAIGSERYTPYQQTTEPRELLTQANAILGQGQLSLAKYLWIIDHACGGELDIHDAASFLQAVLQRVDWTRDLHFQTRTTIDTLDYSGSGLNTGSKVVIAAVGPARRTLPGQLSAELELPAGWSKPRVCMPGVLAVQGPPFCGPQRGDPAVPALCDRLAEGAAINRFPLVVLVDDSDFVARNVNNFLWVTFTRSNPATDIQGVGAQVVDKHWGCRGSLVIDARIKPHHAPPLVEDSQTQKRIDALAAAGGPLARYL